MLLLLGAPAFAMGERQVLTVKADWSPKNIGNEGMLVAGFGTQFFGAPSLLSVQLVREAAGWIPVWYIVLESEHGIVGTSGVPENKVKIGPFTLSPDRIYHTTVSFNTQTGDLSLAMRQRDSGETLYAGAWTAVAYDGPVYAVTNEKLRTTEHAWYEPVETVVEVGTRNGAFIPTNVIEPGKQLWVRLTAETEGTGEFHVSVADGSQLRRVLRLDAKVGETLAPIPKEVFGLGQWEVLVQYVVEDEVQFTYSRPVYVGSLKASLGSVWLDRSSSQLRATLRLDTESFLYGLDMQVKAHMEPVIPQTLGQLGRMYGEIADVRGSLRQTTFLQPGATNISVGFPVPDEPGVWRVRFSLEIRPDIHVNWTSGEFMFATATPDQLTLLQGDNLPVPKEDSTLRICTYNVLGFQGYPEAEAAVALGGPNDPRRIDHFAKVFRQMDCDVYGLQEAGSAQMLQLLGEALEMNVAVYPSYTIYMGGLLSRFPILETRSFNDPTRSGPFSRFAGASLLDIDGELTWVVNLHAYPHTLEMREQEAEVLARNADVLLADNPRVIALGDFNSRVGEVIHQVLTERGFVNALEVNSKNGVPSIDHIYVSSALASRIDIGWIIRDPGFTLNGMEGPGIWAHSDHVPTVVDLKW